MKAVVNQERLNKLINFIDELTSHHHVNDDDPCWGCPTFQSCCQAAGVSTCQEQLKKYLCE